jgi:hypothetical protein
VDPKEDLFKEVKEYIAEKKEPEDRFSRFAGTSFFPKR